MATNSFFESSYTSAVDQGLVESLIIESIKIYGRDVIYLPRDHTDLDLLFGEDAASEFKKSFEIEMYLKSVDGFGGDGDFLSGMGLEIRDEVVLSVSMKRFSAEVAAATYDLVRPREGDLIKLPPSWDDDARIYEISFVEEAAVNLQLGRLYTWEVRAKLFEYSGEDFDTDIEEVDTYDNDLSISTEYELNVGGSGAFVINENVTQSNGWHATVIGFEGNMVTVIKRTGEPLLNEAIIGAQSGAAWFVKSTLNQVGNDPQANNDELDAEEDFFVDFDENNPFSD